jgi:hypothetical protein
LRKIGVEFTGLEYDGGDIEGRQLVKPHSRISLEAVHSPASHAREDSTVYFTWGSKLYRLQKKGSGRLDHYALNSSRWVVQSAYKQIYLDPFRLAMLLSSLLAPIQHGNALEAKW